MDRVMSGELISPRKKKIYVAGPMRGIPDFNFPAFYKAEADLLREGWDVFNPARSDDEVGSVPAEIQKTGDIDLAAQAGFSLRHALARDTEWIALHADAIYMLKGWEKSAGANAEWALAKALGLEIHYE